MKIKPTRERITDALAGGALSFHELAMRVYPPESHPQRDLNRTTPLNPIDVPHDLSGGEQAILLYLERKPLELHWGRNGWVPDRLPKPAKRADFDRICKRKLVEVRSARLVLASDPD